MKIKQLFLLNLLCLLFSPQSFSGPTTGPMQYQVEVIIFQNTIPPVANSEDFSGFPALPETSKAVNLGPENDAHTPYSELPYSWLRLRAEARLIKRKPDYKLLLHTAWLQQEGRSKTVHLDNDFQEGSAPKLDGTIRVSKGLYYYFSVNLALTPINTLLRPKQKPFILKQKRRLRSDEVHYIDHPQFGVLIKVHPLKMSKS